MRFWTAKNIGKLNDISLLPILTEAIEYEEDTTVRRELVSSIGRMRNEKTKEFLNKEQAEKLNTEWVELRAENGFKHFKIILEKFSIPHNDLNVDVNKKLDTILSEILDRE